MRWRVAVLGVVVLGCVASPTQVAIPDPPDDPWQPPRECVADVDCVAAGSKCCDCPTFAVPQADPIHQACVDVICPLAACSDHVEPACDGGRCVLACVATACQQSCANGFASDDNGCLTCGCAAPVVDGCDDVADCVRVRADCCGCDHGGRDTAVLRRDARAYDEALMCGPEPQCPAVSSACWPGAELQCVQGQCALSSLGELPPNACGRPDLPRCPIGQVCVINGSEGPAAEQGVGECQPPPRGREGDGADPASP